MPLNRQTLGKTYGPFTMKVEEDMGKNYALATNDRNPWYLDGKRPGGIIAPPMVAVVYSGPVVGPVLFDSDVGANLARLVHGEEELWFQDVVRPGDEITSQSKIVGMEEKATGELLLLEGTSTKADGTPVLKGLCGFFIRGEKKGDGGPKPEPEKPPSNLLFTQAMEVTQDQSLRYAEASGDHNPIHVNDDFARSVGLPGIILQGLCTMAFVAKAVVDTVLKGDPRGLKRLRVRFSKPVLPKDTVTTYGWKTGQKGKLLTLGVLAQNQSGVTVIKDASADAETA